MLHILNSKILGLILILIVGSFVFSQAKQKDENIVVPTDANENIVNQIKEIIQTEKETKTAGTTTSTIKPNTDIPTPLPLSTQTTTTSATSIPATSKTSGITLAEIEKHNSKSDCWSAINGSVYDLTSWVPNHPGGASRILILCGKDGSKEYNGAHGTKTKMFNILTGFKIGSLAN